MEALRKQYSKKDNHGSAYGDVISTGARSPMRQRKEEAPSIKVREVMEENKQRTRNDLSQSRITADNGNGDAANASYKSIMKSR